MFIITPITNELQPVFFYFFAQLRGVNPQYPGRLGFVVIGMTHDMPNMVLFNLRQGKQRAGGFRVRLRPGVLKEIIGQRLFLQLVAGLDNNGTIDDVH